MFEKTDLHLPGKFQVIIHINLVTVVTKIEAKLTFSSGTKRALLNFSTRTFGSSIIKPVERATAFSQRLGLVLRDGETKLSLGERYARAPCPSQSRDGSTTCHVLQGLGLLTLWDASKSTVAQRTLLTLSSLSLFLDCMAGVQSLSSHLIC